MGQYFIAVNLSKKEYLHPHDYDTGAKLTEHSWVGDNLIDAVINLLADEWKHDRIVWAGDYAEIGLFVPGSSKKNLYDYASENFKKLTRANKELSEQFQYICNADTEQYVNVRKLPVSSWGETIHPLPLLTSCGNGQGSGDYCGPDEHLCGFWAADRIFVSSKAPEGYSELVVQFKE